MDGWMGAQMYGTDGRMDGRMDAWVDGWMDGRIDRTTRSTMIPW